MEDNNNLITGLVIGFVIGIILSVIFINSSSSKNYVSQDSCDEIVSEYKDKLDEANEKINNLNSAIEDAKSSAWESYDEMGNALDNLETEEPVDEP